MNTLVVKNVSKRFGGVVALDGCSLTVELGTITALIGPNGSGKTTLFDVISQLEDEDAGKILFNNEDITKHSPFSAYKVAQMGISRTFQQVRLFKNLTIRQHLELAMNSHDTQLVKNILSGKQEDGEAEIQHILSLVRLDKPLDTTVSGLSYGQRKLLDLAMAIAKPHAFLMLDEPVAGVNPATREIIVSVLQTLRKTGETILFIEHDMNFTMKLADYVYVLDAGSIIAEGKPKAVQKNRKVLAAYLGESHA